MGWPWLDQACCGVVSNVVCCDVSTLRGAVFKLSAAPLPPSKPATGNTAEIEEERRLLYVAMTRAKDHLHLILPQRFFAHQQKSNGDRHMYASRTQFVPAAILDRFESCAWPETPATTLAAQKATDPVDITTRLRRMWR
jgi:DNA helicase II / ATP-dependent DNA helicase PcrA